MKITLDELLMKIPEEWRPVAVQYGPALLSMAAEDLWAWIELLAKGDEREAIARLARSSPGTMLAMMASSEESMKILVRENADRMATQRGAILLMLRVLLGIAAAAVGL